MRLLLGLGGGGEVDGRQALEPRQADAVEQRQRDDARHRHAGPAAGVRLVGGRVLRDVGRDREIVVEQAGLLPPAMRSTKPPPEEKPAERAMHAGLVEAEAFDEVGQVVVELAEIGDVAVGGAAAAMAAQADRVDGGAGRLQRLGELEHRDVGARRAVHQHDRAVGPAGIEAVVEGRAVARLEGLQLGQLGEVPLRDAGDRIAGGQHRRRGRRVEGDDGGEAPTTMQDAGHRRRSGYGEACAP